MDGITISANDYCLTNGTINIATATATAASEGKYKAAVIAGTTSTTDKTYTVIKQAIVYPDTQFGDTDDDVIAVVQADGNVYYVTAKQIRAKITEVGGHTDFKTKAGYNYIINVTVNKTGLLTTATVTAWNEVVSDEAYPKINVTGSETQTVSLPSSVCGKFDFWYSETIDGGYVCGATPSIISDGTMDWKETNLLYWPDHNTHYHFRGLFPYRDEDAKTGPLVVEDKGIKTAILDVSFTCHMPDCLEMPYFPDVRGAEHVDLEKATEPLTYRLGGNSCLSGDFMGSWRFAHALQEGDEVIFEDMIHYTTVKTNTFNGISHPSIGMLHEDGTLEILRRFSYEDYRNRMD